MKLVKETCQKQGMVSDANQLFEYFRTYEDKQEGQQLSIFDL